MEGVGRMLPSQTGAAARPATVAPMTRPQPQRLEAVVQPQQQQALRHKQVGFTTYWLLGIVFPLQLTGALSSSAKCNSSILRPGNVCSSSRVLGILAGNTQSANRNWAVLFLTWCQFRLFPETHSLGKAKEAKEVPVGRVSGGRTEARHCCFAVQSAPQRVINLF